LFVGWEEKYLKAYRNTPECSSMRKTTLEINISGERSLFVCPPMGA